MKAKKAILSQKDRIILENIGENIKLARLRRKLTAEQVAERANIGRSTLWHVEKGSEHISIGIILKVLSVFGMENDLKNLALNDALGQKLQDAGLIVKKRAPRSKQ
ncbi:MAG: helix-turn-helix transcriptional regulator [Candidatus Marinimicrobia bacterium]|nr:helix-turn-helix transcriptional regulator [Candidatus Neomarinimicrobiota bacterium]